VRRLNIVIKSTKPRMRLKAECHREGKFEDWYTAFIGLDEDLRGLAWWAGSKRVQDVM
jgi:hypothetical protein